MLKKKPDITDIVFHSGIYKFSFPYLAFNFVPNEEGISPVYDCDVEIHVGNQNDLNNAYLVTVIISAKKGGVGVTNFIEGLATQIKSAFIDNKILTTRNKNNNFFEVVRWVERNHYPKENYKLVSLEWNENQYKNPKWSKLEEDWIINDNKLEKYN